MVSVYFVSEAVLRAAAGLASIDVRTLGATHLASAQQVDPDEVLTYDRRLREAARNLDLPVSHPGAPG